MKIKPSIITGVTGISLMTSVSVFAMNYDVRTLSTDQITQAHAYTAESFLCGPQCSALGGGESEARYLFHYPHADRVDNGDGTLTYAGVSVAGGGTDAEPEYAFNRVHLPLVPAESNPVASGLYNFMDWNLTSRADGKIIGGYYEVFSDFGSGLLFDSCFNWDKNRVETYAGDAALVDCATIDPNAPPAGVVLDSHSYLDYLTCDVDEECGQFGKSVPVPAFAAAALGLGLVGVTYLTGRRRRSIV